jgi:hypothetical protein
MAGNEGTLAAPRTLIPGHIVQNLRDSGREFGADHAARALLFHRCLFYCLSHVNSRGTVHGSAACV